MGDLKSRERGDFRTTSELEASRYRLLEGGGVLPSNPYITPVTTWDVLGVPQYWGLSGFQPS